MTAPFGAINYYKVSPDLAGHPKMVTLSEELGLDEDTALGKWHRLLSWAAKYLPETGNLSRYPAKQIVRVMGLPDDTDPERLLKALVLSELCDEVDTPDTHVGTQLGTQVGTQVGPHDATQTRTSVVIHDWLVWHDDVIEAREVSDARSHGGKYGAHLRHHVNAGVVNKACGFCLGDLEPPSKVTYMRKGKESRGEESRGTFLPEIPNTEKDPTV